MYINNELRNHVHIIDDIYEFNITMSVIPNYECHVTISYFQHVTISYFQHVTISLLKNIKNKKNLKLIEINM